MRLKRALDEMDVRLPALNSIVLSGFEGAASVSGARTPKTKPVPLTTSVDENTTKSGETGTRPPRAPKKTDS
jgi:small conductance mechanosensitive channel